MKPHFALVPITKILSNKQFYIRNYKNDNILDLTNSIKKFGLIQPLIVKRRNLGYQIICGERRYRACLKAGLEKVPVLICNYNSILANSLNFNDNCYSKPLHFLDKYIAINKYMTAWDLNKKQLSEIININSNFVDNSLLFSNLNRAQINAIYDSKITEEQAKTLLKVSNEKAREQFIEYLKSNELSQKQTDLVYNKLFDEKTKKIHKGIVPQDTRIVINTISKTVDNIRKNGFTIDFTQTNNTNYVECYLRIKKPRSQD